MAKGSQLKQLKSALSQDPALSQKKRKRSDSKLREVEKSKRQKKLQDIHEQFNPFDVKVTKLKHDVGGRKLKGLVGRPGLSKQVGLEQRSNTLLKELSLKGHSGGIIDRRFGENDPTMTPEERMLERFTRERQREAKGSAFNLEDEDELTHYGQSLSRLDDFDGLPLDLDEDDEEESGAISREQVSAGHFGGFGDDDTNKDPDKKKSKAEVMAEVIAKSKQHKYQRQLERQQDDDVRHRLDEEFDDIRALLINPSAASDGPKATSAKEDTSESIIKSTGQDLDYDQRVKELALDRRAKPKDRTKTEEELAVEAKEALEKAERKRLKRMRGEEDDSDGEAARERGGALGGGDDLEDDFGGGYAGMQLGGGLGAESGDEADDIDIDGLEEDDEEAGSDEDKDDEDEDEDGDPESDGDSNEELVDGDEGSDEDQAGNSLLEAPARSRKTTMTSKNSELPYTFPCPESLEEFLEIVEDIEDEGIPVVVQRMRALHHPSLAAENQYKLQALNGVLIDYILHITAPPEPQLTLLRTIIPHLHALTVAYPIQSAQYFKTKLSLMQKNLTKGLAKGATSLKSRTWPGSSELSLLSTIPSLWPTSDMNHHVVSPARLLMGSYLGLARVRTARDLVAGLFLSSLFLQFEELSKRFVPEAVNFVVNALLHLCPHRFTDTSSLPGSFPSPDFNSAQCQSLRIDPKKIGGRLPIRPSLAEFFNASPDASDIARLNLLSLALSLVESYADMYKSLEGFVELYQPIRDVCAGLRLKGFPESVQAKNKQIVDALSRMLKFSRQARKPLALQAHKPIPIASYFPKFDATSSSYLRNQDPDRERAEASKLRRQYKEERKGAIRELRKDAKFLAAVQQKEQQEKDRAYKERMDKVFSSLESERAEQKKMDKEKAKEKRRAGKK